jgi:uncharacterized membrane protein YdjX (TVP38/TMEM64 family)
MDALGLMYFDPWFAFATSEAGIMLGATVAFSVARLVRRSLSGRTLRLSVPLTELVERVDSAGRMTWTSQFRTWFIVRLFTNPLFDPLCYAAGLTRVRFAPFILASLLGNIPSTALFFVLEQGALRRAFQVQIAVNALFLMAIWLRASRWLSRA